MVLDYSQNQALREELHLLRSLLTNVLKMGHTAYEDYVCVIVALFGYANMIDEKDELHAALFNILFDVVLSHEHPNPLLLNRSPSPKPYRTLDVGKRVIILQKIFSSLRQPIRNNTFSPKKRWRRLALRAQKTFKNMPRFEVLNNIIYNQPYNKNLQVMILKKEFPVLFQPGISRARTYPLLPLPVLMASNVKQNTINLNKTPIPLKAIMQKRMLRLRARAKRRRLRQFAIKSVEQLQTKPYTDKVQPLTQTTSTKHFLPGLTHYKMMQDKNAKDETKRAASLRPKAPSPRDKP